RIAGIAREIDVGLTGRRKNGETDDIPTLLCVLKGAFFFTADLSRRLRAETRLHFVHATSYQGTASMANVDLVGDFRFATGKTVIVLEDIIDTGQTLHALVGQLRGMNAKRVEVAALLYKDSERTRNSIQALDVDHLYLGLQIPDQFVVGYGLD